MTFKMNVVFNFLKVSVIDKIQFYISKAFKDPRYRKALITSATSAFVRLVSFAANMAIVRLTFGYLGAELYGLWMAITAFVFFNVFADFGIGNGLTNLVAECYGKRDQENMKRYISSTFFSLSMIMLLFTAISVVTIPRLDFAALLNLANPELAMAAEKGTLILAVIFSINISLGVAQRVQMGLQEGYKTNIFLFINSIVSVFFVFMAIRVQFPFYGIVLAFSLPQLLTNFANNFYLFVIERNELRPKWKYFDKKIMRRIFNLGFYFFILQLMVTLTYTLDNAIIAKRFTLNDVSDYSIIQRLFSIGPIIFGLMLSPLWPAYGEAKAAKDYNWIWKTFKRSFWLCFIIGLTFSIALLVGSKFILAFWLGKNLYPPFSLLLGFAAWSLVGGVFGGVASTLLNGLSVLKFQMYCAIAAGITSFLIKIFVPVSFGVSSIIWSTVVTYIVFIVVPITIYIYRMKIKFFPNVLTEGIGKMN
jgi:O-antigen/teichoic acid export membrane protein